MTEVKKQIHKCSDCNCGSGGENSKERCDNCDCEINSDKCACCK